MDLMIKVIIALSLSILLVSCCAQSQGHAQSVGGDFGRAWLNSSNIQSPISTSASNSGNSLWDWGGAPRGRIAVNGKLVPDPYYFWKSLNYSSGWLGQVYVDSKTGYPIYGFLDPYTGYPNYFYVDPSTGQPVFVNSGLTGGYPYYSEAYPYSYYANAYPYYSPSFQSSASKYYPWLSPTTLPYGNMPNYLGGGLGYY